MKTPYLSKHVRLWWLYQRLKNDERWLSYNAFMYATMKAIMLGKPTVLDMIRK